MIKKAFQALKSPKAKIFLEVILTCQLIKVSHNIPKVIAFHFAIRVKILLLVILLKLIQLIKMKILLVFQKTIFCIPLIFKINKITQGNYLKKIMNSNIMKMEVYSYLILIIFYEIYLFPQIT